MSDGATDVEVSRGYKTWNDKRFAWLESCGLIHGPRNELLMHDQ